MLGRVYMHFQNYKWAIDEFEALLADSGGEVTADRDFPGTDSVLLLAECHDMTGNPSRAIELYDMILSVEPHNAIAHGAKGLLLLGKRRLLHSRFDCTVEVFLRSLVCLLI